MATHEHAPLHRLPIPIQAIIETLVYADSKGFRVPGPAAQGLQYSQQTHRGMHNHKESPTSVQAIIETLCEANLGYKASEGLRYLVQPHLIDVLLTPYGFGSAGLGHA